MQKILLPALLIAIASFAIAASSEWQQKHMARLHAGAGALSLNNGLTKTIDHSLSHLDASATKGLVDEYIHAVEPMVDSDGNVEIESPCQFSDRTDQGNGSVDCFRLEERVANAVSKNALLLASMSKEEALQLQTQEALLLAAGPKTELAVIHAEFGTFSSDRISKLSAGTGDYIETSWIEVSADERVATIHYQFGSDAFPELAGKVLQIVGEIVSDDRYGQIEWSCRSDSAVIREHWPAACMPPAEQ